MVGYGRVWLIAVVCGHTSVRPCSTARWPNIARPRTVCSFFQFFIFYATSAPAIAANGRYIRRYLSWLPLFHRNSRKRTASANVTVNDGFLDAPGQRLLGRYHDFPRSPTSLFVPCHHVLHSVVCSAFNPSALILYNSDNDKPRQSFY